MTKTWSASVALLLAGAAGCARETCHEPSTNAVPAQGDANADGAVDVSDGIYLQRWLFHGGPAPACEAAVDLVDDGTVDAADSVAIWSRAFVKNVTPPALADGACDTRAAPSNNLECGHVDYTVDAPSRATGSFDATVRLASPDFAVEGWEIAVKADGCSVTSATFDGTSGADVGSGGQRSTGFARADLTTDGGVVAAVALSWLDDRTLSASGTPTPILAIHVKGDDGAADCTPCTLAFEDGETGPAAPVRNVVTRLGRSWKPTQKGVTVSVCKG